MAAFFLRIYDWLAGRRMWLGGVLALLCALLLAGLFSLGRNEDILDFLPVDNHHRKALNLYQELSAADRIVAIVLPRDSMATVPPDRLADAAERFAAAVAGRDSLGAVRDLMTRIDYGRLFDTRQFLYDHIPCFLTDADYERIDSLLTPGYIEAQIARDRMLLMFPTGSLLSDHVRQDPLNLFTPAVARLQQFQPGFRYELYDGYILTPDRKRAIVTMRTPYGSNETDSNARLIALLRDAADAVEADTPELEVHLAGAPVIAVTNARQIKADSLRSIAVAVVLILALLLWTLRSMRSLLLIGVSILFGWLFAMGGMSLLRDEVSMIILGIGSIIIGIAVNYPLHMLAHLRHEHDMRAALREIVSPLVIGNITTVGAFLCLVPMTAPALRDLGLFAAFMLVGTILFVLVFLPHLVGKRPRTEGGGQRFLRAFSAIDFERKPRLVLGVCLLTVLFAFFSRHTAFDTDMRHINYMTDGQRADLEAFSRMLGPDNLTTVYVASESATWDGALQRSETARGALERIVAEYPGSVLESATPFLPSRSEQLRRLARWEEFVGRQADSIRTQLAAALRANGFREDAFAGFEALLDKPFAPLGWEELAPLAGQLFEGYLNEADGTCTVVDRVKVLPGEVGAVEETLRQRIPGSYCFDVQGMNGAIADSLTGDFNYIGWSCGVIVFLFLWFSFGRLELSLMAFLPMAVSWLWILGLMELLDIRFNIVNIILATFIFGQGDDYTIFITEGLVYEHAYGRKLLASYKSSIVISALIMLIGIGTLIISRHPAMRSLAEVTIVGMFTVVLMAYIIPPFIYRWLVRRRGGGLRTAPVTLGQLLRTGWFRMLLAAELLGAILLRLVSGNSRRLLGRYIRRVAGWDLRYLPGIGFRTAPLPAGAQVIAARYHADVDLLAAAAAGAGVVADRRFPALISALLRTTHALVPAGNADGACRRGWQVVCFGPLPDGLHAPVIPMGIHGSGDLYPDGGPLLEWGSLRVEYGAPVAAGAAAAAVGTLEDAMRMRFGTARYYAPQVLARYRYKGPEVEARARRVLRGSGAFSRWIDRGSTPRTAVVVNNGQGEFGLLLALVHPECEVHVFEQDADRAALARHVAAQPANLHPGSDGDPAAGEFPGAMWFLIDPTPEQRAKYPGAEIVTLG